MIYEHSLWWWWWEVVVVVVVESTASWTRWCSTASWTRECAQVLGSHAQDDGTDASMTVFLLTSVVEQHRSLTQIHSDVEMVTRTAKERMSTNQSGSVATTRPQIHVRALHINTRTRSRSTARSRVLYAIALRTLCSTYAHTRTHTRHPAYY